MKQFMGILLALALALALAGCGGGSGGGTGTPVDPGPSPSDTLAKVTAALTAAANLNTASTTLTGLSGAATEDGSALNAASAAADKITTLGSDGDSKVAKDNAQAVLTAKANLEKALKDVEDMEDAATAAKTALAGLSDKDAAKDATGAIDRALAAAETAKKAANDVLDAKDSVTGSLASYVKMVSADKTDTTPAKSPATVGDAVAEAILAALEPDSNQIDGRALRVTHGTTAPADAIADANKLEDNDHQGMVWSELRSQFGTDLINSRVEQGNGTRPVTAVGVEGKAVSDFFETVPGSLDTDGDTVADGYQRDQDAVYKGIEGVLFCIGSDCAREDAKLSGSWYFAADSETIYYTPDAATEGNYTVEALYARYGHWLVVSTTGDTAGQATVNTFATSATTESGSWAAADGSSTDPGLRQATADYSGNVAGRSVHKTFDSDLKVLAIQSGRFTADVNLKAKFADSEPKLGGTIDNFMGVDNADAVDPGWTVTLEDGTIFGGAFANGVTKGGGGNGVWSATSYGESGRRPTGIYGGFNAHFTDGHAAGAYATRKD